jgi:phosphoribosylformimino-5-aminoimidazole carboxamide ribotide isomerase
MSLKNVGANNGVDVDLILEIISRANGFNIIAAGGIRSKSDLLMLKSIGANTALVATALHQKQITMEQLRNLDK